MRKFTSLDEFDVPEDWRPPLLPLIRNCGAPGCRSRDGRRHCPAATWPPGGTGARTIVANSPSGGVTPRPFATEMPARGTQRVPNSRWRCGGGRLRVAASVAAPLALSLGSSRIWRAGGRWWVCREHRQSRARAAPGARRSRRRCEAGGLVRRTDPSPRPAGSVKVTIGELVREIRAPFGGTNVGRQILRFHKALDSYPTRSDHRRLEAGSEPRAVPLARSELRR